MAKKREPKIRKTVSEGPKVRVPKTPEELIDALIADFGVEGEAAEQMRVTLKSAPIDKLKELWAERDPGDKSFDVPQAPVSEGGDEIKIEAAEGETPGKTIAPAAAESASATPKEYHRIAKNRVDKLQVRIQNLLDEAHGRGLIPRTDVNKFLKDNDILAISEAGDFAKAEALANKLAGPPSEGPRGGGGTWQPKGGKGKGRSTGRVPTTEEAPVPLSIEARLKKAGIPANMQGLIDEVGFDKLPPGMQAAVAKLRGGDPGPLMALLGAEGSEAQASEDILDPAIIDKAVRGKKALAGSQADLKALRAEIEKMKGGFLREPPKSLQNLGKGLDVGLETVEDPDKLRRMIKAAKKTGAYKMGSERDPETAMRLKTQASDALAEQARLGPSFEEGTADQIKNRIEEMLKMSRKGDVRGVAGAAGAVEQAEGFGLKQLRESPVGKFLLKSKDPALRKLAQTLETGVASDLGAGAGAGMLESLGAKVAAEGGGMKLAGKGILAFLPLLMLANEKLKEGTSNKRAMMLEQIQQANAPSVESLLATYRAKQFAEQGVTTAAPDPNILRALQKMGPQLTSSEVYIGPDRSYENAQKFLAENND